MSSTQLDILRDFLVEDENEMLILQLTTKPLARLAFPTGQDIIEGIIFNIDGGHVFLLKDFI